MNGALENKNSTNFNCNNTTTIYNSINWNDNSVPANWYGGIYKEKAENKLKTQCS